MEMKEKPPLAKWLDSKYLQWQNDLEQRKTVIEFADYLEVNRSLLSYWMNGSRDPSEDNLVKLAFKLGFEIYDVLEKDRPNILYLYVLRNWQNAPQKIQKQLAEIIAKYSSEAIPDEIKETSTTKSK